ncbi:MAG: zinc-binding dehydrogenase [Paenarthrobacter ureafaciens]|uniref:zinc-dependent alcohol dehydrogenase n=1 Tax=Paenarthrobacter ureafaciens TaxID=37931 RepID=UPI001AC91C10|nr:zinc-binding dehydrogenase [Paenarthrobacter ureafaciens]MBN9128848.1 zinc-binding dehydrogenase [Paenarthrobacter ureafaciens]
MRPEPSAAVVTTGRPAAVGLEGSPVRASVTVDAKRNELRSFPLPHVGADAALLRIEAAGVCGSDVDSYGRDLPPRIMGHENVGTLFSVGELAAARWGMGDGDRVLLEEYLPCGHCHFCRSSEFRSCLASDTSANPVALRFGSTGIDVGHGLWGGYAEVMYVHPNSVPHKVPDGVSPVLATLGLPLGNGYQWAYLDGGTRPGDCVVIMGPGQAGIGSLLAAREAGAGTAVVIGLERDQQRLDIARRFGADATLVVDGPNPDDAVAAVQDLTNGTGANLVIDAAAGTDETLGLAIDMVAKRGRIIMAAASRTPLRNFPVWKLSRKHLDLQAVRGHSFESVEWALRLIASGKYPLGEMSNFVGGLDDVDAALRATGGWDANPILHATIVP